MENISHSPISPCKLIFAGDCWTDESFCRRGSCGTTSLVKRSSTCMAHGRNPSTLRKMLVTPKCSHEREVAIPADISIRLLGIKEGRIERKARDGSRSGKTSYVRSVFRQIYPCMPQPSSVSLCQSCCIERMWTNQAWGLTKPVASTSQAILLLEATFAYVGSIFCFTLKEFSILYCP